MGMCIRYWINIIIVNISLIWDVSLLLWRNASVIFLYVYVIGQGIIQTLLRVYCLYACIVSSDKRFQPVYATDLYVPLLVTWSMMNAVKHKSV